MYPDDDLTDLVENYCFYLPSHQQTLFSSDRSELLKRLKGLVAATETALVAGLIWSSPYQEGHLSINYLYAKPDYEFILNRLVGSFLNRVKPKTQRIIVDLYEGREIGIDKILTGRGFQRIHRTFLSRDLVCERRTELDNSLLSIENLEQWDTTTVCELASLIRTAYKEHTDSVIYPFLVDDRLSIEYVSRVLANRYGKFLPNISFLVRDKFNSTLLGAIMALRRGQNQNVFIYQLAVEPSYQNRGVGRTLIQLSLQAAQKEGFKRCYLLMTAANARAYNLYLALGFRPLSQESVYLYDRELGYDKH